MGTRCARLYEGAELGRAVLTATRTSSKNLLPLFLPPQSFDRDLACECQFERKGLSCADIEGPRHVG